MVRFPYTAAVDAAIGFRKAKVVAHARYVILQPVGLAGPRQLFESILGRIGRRHLACASG